MDTFLWHDYETFGADPRRDRPAQFAALRTDPDLEPVGEPIVIYCQPANDMLPHPDACMLTDITPQRASERGVPENQFADAIAKAMQQPGTCSVGYNNFRFDDEVTRHLFWRNFFDPYAREWTNGNTRFDLIDLTRMTRALRPSGLQWPDRADGTPSFRLEDLAAANGLDTRHAHDALADVEATVGLARKLWRAQPRLWDWALKLRHRHFVSQLVEARQPLLHSSSRLPAQWSATAPVLPLIAHPVIRTQWLIWNLREDPRPYLELPEEMLADLLWTPTADLPEGQQRLPVKLIRINRCPMLAPMSVLDTEAARRLAIDADTVASHATVVRNHPEFCKRLQALFDQPAPALHDPELALYSGFTPKADLPLRDRVRSVTPQQLSVLNNPFQDGRLNEMLFRYRARLWPESLDSEDQERWTDYRRRRLVEDPELASVRLDGYRERVHELAQSKPDQAEILDELFRWPSELGFKLGGDHLSST